MKFSFLNKLPKKSDFSLISFTSEAEKAKTIQQGNLLRINLLIEPKKINRRRLINLGRLMIKRAKAAKVKKAAINWRELVKLADKIIDRADLAEIMATNWEMANFEFNRYKSEAKKESVELKKMMIIGELTAAEKKSFQQGKIIGEEVNGCRYLANTPGGDVTPEILAQAAKEEAKKLPIKVKILGVEEMRRLKMGGLLGVSKGSSEEPRFIIMEYLNGGRQNPIVLVGKGITFDTGGLNLKPSDAIYEMHMDMSGGSAVMHAVVIAARLKLKINVVALVPAAENMPSGSSYRPGDILTMMSGQTVEVLNTDAEGRIILADALTYAKKYQPQIVIDVATLTGAAMVALGEEASALFTKDQNISHEFEKLGEISGDYLWPLPLWEEYEENIKGTFADWANVGKSRYGGAITGAIFLYQFAKDYPWVHLDIAPKMTANAGDCLAKGASGAPVRLLAKYLMAKSLK